MIRGNLGKTWKMALITSLVLYAVSSCVLAAPQRYGNSIGFARTDRRGDTNIPCYRPGNFVQAPDGCNRCYCEQDGRLTSVCSRAICPPGFPSGNSRRVRPGLNALRFDRQ